ncbi:MAG: hypothetical protein AAF492_28840 [Verrucomicrobiota bacterium]
MEERTLSKKKLFLASSTALIAALSVVGCVTTQSGSTTTSGTTGSGTSGTVTPSVSAVDAAKPPYH